MEAAFPDRENQARHRVVVWLLCLFCFNRATGLILVSTTSVETQDFASLQFQSRDWVDIGFDMAA